MLHVFKIKTLCSIFCLIWNLVLQISVGLSSNLVFVEKLDILSHMISFGNIRSNAKFPTCSFCPFEEVLRRILAGPGSTKI